MEKRLFLVLVAALALGGCTVYEPGSIVYGQPAAASGTAGQNCREYQTNAVIDGRSQMVLGTACQQSDGSWRSVPMAQ